MITPQFLDRHARQLTLLWKQNLYCCHRHFKGRWAHQPPITICTRSSPTVPTVIASNSVASFHHRNQPADSSGAPAAQRWTVYWRCWSRVLLPCISTLHFRLETPLHGPSGCPLVLSNCIFKQPRSEFLAGFPVFKVLPLDMIPRSWLLPPR